MAETLTFENTTEQTSAENLTSDEQDSLKVGEALVEEQEQLLAGKYKDAQELEKAYVELQKKIGEKNPEDSESTGESDDTDEGEKETEEEEETDENSEGTILDDLWNQAIDNDFDEGTLEEISKMDPQDLAKMHLEYRAQQEPQEFSKEDVENIQSITGGADGYKDMMTWATDNLNKQEIDMFDAVMEKGDALAAFFAVRSLAYRWEDAKGYDGKMLTGTAPKESGDKFRSQAEVVQAMSDPRYERDPAFRQDIMKKLERSDINF